MSLASLVMVSGYVYFTFTPEVSWRTRSFQVLLHCVPVDARLPGYPSDGQALALSFLNSLPPRYLLRGGLPWQGRRLLPFPMDDLAFALFGSLPVERCQNRRPPDYPGRYGPVV